MSNFTKIQAARLAARKAGIAQPQASVTQSLLTKLAHVESNAKAGLSKYLDLRVALSDERYNQGCRFSSQFVAPVAPTPAPTPASTDAVDMSFVNLCL